jgi:hypothetical protein
MSKRIIVASASIKLREVKSKVLAIPAAAAVARLPVDSHIASDYVRGIASATMHNH